MLTRSHKSPGSDSAETQRQVRRSSRSTPDNSQSPTHQAQSSPQASSKPRTSPSPTLGSLGVVAKSKTTKAGKDEAAVSLDSTPPVAIAFESAPISIPSKTVDPRTKRVLSMRKSGTESAAAVITAPQRVNEVASSKQPQQTVSFVSKSGDLSRKRKKEESATGGDDGESGDKDDGDDDDNDNEDKDDEEEEEDDDDDDDEDEDDEDGSSMESSSEDENDGSDGAGESNRMSSQANPPQVKIKLRSNLLQSQISANGLESDSQNGNSLSSLKRIKMRLGANKKQTEHDDSNDGVADDAVDGHNAKKFPKIIARRGAMAPQGPMSPPNAEAMSTTDSSSAHHGTNSTPSTKKIIKARLGSSKASQETAEDGSVKRESLDNSAGDSARDDGLTPSQKKGKLSRSEKNRTIMHEDGDPQSPTPADESLETPSKRVRRTRASGDNSEKRQPLARPTSGSKKPGDVTATPSASDTAQTPRSKSKARATPVSRGKYSSGDFENPDLVIDSEDSEDDSDDSDDSENDDDKEDGDDSRSGRRLHASVGSKKSRFVKAKRSGGKKGSDADQGSSRKATNSEKNSDSDDFSDDDDSGNEKRTDKQGKRRDSSSSPKLARMTGPKPRCLPDLYRAVVRFGKRKDRHEIFQQPVTEEEAPMYFSIIDTPMDFETLSANVEKNVYPSFEKFKHHLFLIFKNAMKYNPSDTIYYREAKRLNKWVLKYISRMAERLDIPSLPYVAEPKVKKPKEQPTPTQTPGANRTGPRLDAFNSHSLGSRADMPHGSDSTPSHMHHSHSTYPSSSHAPQYPLTSPMSRYSHPASHPNDTPSARYPHASSNLHSMAYAHQSHTGAGNSSQADSGPGTFAHPSNMNTLRSPNISRTLDQSYSNEDSGSFAYPRSVGSHPPRLSQNIFSHEMRSIFDPSGPDSLLSSLNKSSTQTSSDNPFRLFGQLYKQVTVDDRKDPSQTKPQPKENEQQNLTPEQSYLTKLYSLENEGFDMSFLAKIFPWFQPTHASKTITNDRKAIIGRLKGQLKETPREPSRVNSQSSMVDAILSQNSQLLYNLQALQIERATPTPSQNERVLYNAVQRTLETLACLTKPSTLASNLRDDADLRAKYHVLLNQPKAPEASAPTKSDPLARS